MYRDEKVIDGILHFRNTPHGEWHKVTLEGMLSKLTRAQFYSANKDLEISQLKEKITSLEWSQESQPDWRDTGEMGG